MADNDVPSNVQRGPLSRQRPQAGWIFLMAVALVIAMIALLKLPIWVSWTGVIPAVVLIFSVTKSVDSNTRLDREQDEEARGRMRAAATRVAALRAKEAELSDPEPDNLAIAELWSATERKIELDRQIVIRQARLYSNASLLAMVIGLFMMAAFIFYAVRAHTASADIAGGISAVAAALTGYLGKTFIRSQEATTAHLRSYFETQLDFLRLLAAERLVEKSSKMADAEAAKILRSMAQDLGAPNDKYHNEAKKKPKS